MLVFSKSKIRARKRLNRLVYGLILAAILVVTALLVHSDFRGMMWTQTAHRILHAVGSLGVKVSQPAVGWFEKVYERFYDAPQKVGLLQEQVSSLEDFKSQAQIMIQENQEFRKLLDLPEWPSYTYTTARILNYDQQDLISYCLIDKGEEDGLTKGLAVFSEEGLLGRIDTVGPRHARVMLVHAEDSRIPVAGEKSAVRAILGGHARPFLKVVHRDQSKNFEHGEQLITIQSEPWLPAGIPVASFEEDEDGTGEGKIISVLHKFQAHFVRILIPSEEERKHQSPKLLLEESKKKS